MITGAMRTTATDITEVMANLLPFPLIVNKHQHYAAIWLAMLSSIHPLHKPIKNAASRLVKWHPTPLHDLMHRYKVQPQKIKTIKATRHKTRWKMGVMTEIITDIDKAIADITQENPDINVFTGGSGIKGKIGARAVLYRNRWLKTKLQYQLESMQHHTVYKGEGIGILLGIKMIRNEWGIWLANIYIDNQAFIAAVSLTKPNSGHYIFDAIQDDITALQDKHRGIKIKVKWVLGHKGIEWKEVHDFQHWDQDKWTETRYEFKSKSNCNYQVVYQSMCMWPSGDHDND
jgi:hypothetical protein